MYAQDSFFDLPIWGRVGVAGISVALFAVLFAVALRWGRGAPLWLSVPGALALFWVYVWISPQAHYQFYHLIFPDLPHQWVIWPPPSPGRAVELLLFQGPSTLSAHGKGLVSWALIGAVLPGVRALRRGERR